MATVKEKLFGLLSLRSLRGHNLLGRFPILKPAYSIYQNIYQATRPETVRVYGKNLYVGKDTIELARQGEHYEQETTEAFKANIKAGDIVVDIGANVGYFTVLASTLVGPSGKVFAFEPMREYYDLLARTVRENGLTNVTTFNTAVGARKGTVTVEHDVIKEGSGVELGPIDELVSGKVDFIKMDIEGYEPMALEGMRRTIERNPRVILVTEFNEPALAEMGTDPQAFLASLRSLGFTMEILGDPQKTGVKNLLCRRK